eukprot:2870750-Pyramimonas_sp.AAC.1
MLAFVDALRASIDGQSAAIDDQIDTSNARLDWHDAHLASHDADLLAMQQSLDDLAKYLVLAEQRPQQPAAVLSGFERDVDAAIGAAMAQKPTSPD